MKSPLSRSIVPLAAGAVLMFGMTACGGDDPADSSAGNVSNEETTEEDSDGGNAELRNGPVPEADPMEYEPEDDLPDEPGDDAALGEQIEYDLISEAAGFTKDYDEDATVDCPDADFGKDQDITCDMTYFEQSSSWDVSITSSSDMFANYKSQPDNAVVSREVAENALRFETESEDVVCEIVEDYLPVEVGSGEEVTCHSADDDGQTSWDMTISGSGTLSFYEQR